MDNNSIKDFINELDDCELRIFMLSSLGLSQREIAETTKYSLKLVNNKMKNLKIYERAYPIKHLIVEVFC